MSIPNLIKSILSIHDLQTKFNQLTIRLEGVQAQMVLTDAALTLAQDKIKELEDKQNEMERECITNDDCEDLIRKEIEALDLSDEVSNCIENLNISIKVH